VDILVLSPMEIIPLNHGASVRIYNLARVFADLGNKVKIICIPYVRANGPSRTIQERNLTILSTSLSHVIFSIFSFVRDLLRSDVVQVEFHTFSLTMPFMTPIIAFLRLVRKPVVLDEHGVEIQYLYEIHDALGTRPSTSGRLRVFLLESLAARLSSSILVCSFVDAERIRHIYRVPPAKMAVVPNGVSDRFLQRIDGYKYGQPTVLFLGSFDHPPNVFGARFLLDRVVPNVFAADKKVTLAFVGRNAPVWLSQGEFHDRIHIFRDVQDVRPFIAGTDVAVAPIFQGSGTRIKILEFMSMGKPVVSTSKGAEGLDVRDGETIQIRDDPQGFGLAILELLKNRHLAQEIGENGRRLVEDRYVWSHLAKDALQIYERLVAVRP